MPTGGGYHGGWHFLLSSTYVCTVQVHTIHPYIHIFVLVQYNNIPPDLLSHLVSIKGRVDRYQTKQNIQSQALESWGESGFWREKGMKPR